MKRVLFTIMLLFITYLSQAAFTGAYTPSSFTLTSTNSNGIVSFNGTTSLTINGTDNVSGSYGINLVTANVTISGFINFSYNVTKIDSGGADPNFPFDEFGYRINGDSTRVAIDLGLGTVSVPVIRYGISACDCWSDIFLLCKLCGQYFRWAECNHL